MINENVGYLARAKQNNLRAWLRNKTDNEKDSLIATGRKEGKEMKKARLEAKVANLKSVREARLKKTS